MGDQISMHDFTHGPEALDWLRNNKNNSALASNRFGPTRDAIEFVERLYSLGAEKVVIPNHALMDDEERVQEEGGPYADAITIFLPADEKLRNQILQICYEEAVREFGEEDLLPEFDAKQKFIFLWWD